jgi:hypothetical protein
LSLQPVDRTSNFKASFDDFTQQQQQQQRPRSEPRQDLKVEVLLTALVKSFEEAANTK